MFQPVQRRQGVRTIALLLLVLTLLLSACLGRTTPEPTATAEPSPFPPTETPLPPTETPAPDPVWDRIQAEGRMYVGLSADYPPFAYVDEDYKVNGFDLALIQEIGRRLDVPLSIRDMAFDGLLPAVQLGQIDAAIAALSVTEEREGLVDFSHVYYVGEDAILARENSQTPIIDVEDLARSRIGVQDGSVYQSWLERTLVDPGLLQSQNLITYTTITAALDALTAPSPAIDFVVVDRLVGENAELERPVRIAARNFNPQRYAIALPQGATTLQAKINEALIEMQNDGVLAALVRQYLQVENYVPPAPATPGAPFPTAAPIGCLDGMAFVQDLTYPDFNMTAPPVFQPQEGFQKGWRIRNTGTCTWNSAYRLVFVDGNRNGADMSGQPVAIQGTVPPGGIYDIYVNLIAPSVPGVYQGFWSMRNPNGLFFGERIWAGIEVRPAATATPSQPAPTATPSTPPVVINSFTVNPNEVPVGQCFQVSWNFDHREALSTVRLLRNNNLIAQDMPANGATQDCPNAPGTLTYSLQIISVSKFGAQEDVTVNVVGSLPEPPAISLFEAVPDQLSVGQCVELTWQFSGDDLALAQIFRGDQVIGNDLAANGVLEDCPAEPGQIIYRLQVDAEFGGSAQKSIFVTVVE